MDGFGLYPSLSVTQIVGRVLIAGFFLAVLIKNLIEWKPKVKMVGAVLPFPGLALAFGFVVQFVGASLILVNYHATIGAIILIMFTMAATVLFLRFWTEEDSHRRHYNMMFFCNNFAIVGGLFLIM